MPTNVSCTGRPAAGSKSLLAEIQSRIRSALCSVPLLLMADKPTTAERGGSKPMSAARKRRHSWPVMRRARRNAALVRRPDTHSRLSEGTDPRGSRCDSIHRDSRVLAV